MPQSEKNPKHGRTPSGKPRQRPSAAQKRAAGQLTDKQKPGRKTISQLAQANLELLDKHGFNPLLFLMQVAVGDHKAVKCKEDELTTAVRVQAAKDILPYVAPKLKALELSDPTGNNPLTALVDAIKASATKANS